MDLLILPYESVGPIKFGMAQTEVHKVLSSKAVVKTGNKLEKADFFHELGIKVCYRRSSPYFCSALVLYEPSNPIFQDQRLLGAASIGELQAWLESIDDSLEITTEAITSYRYGISLHTPDCEILKHEPPKSITVFEKGYFDKKNAISDTEIDEYIAELKRLSGNG